MPNNNLPNKPTKLTKLDIDEHCRLVESRVKMELRKQDETGNLSFHFSIENYKEYTWYDWEERKDIQHTVDWIVEEHKMHCSVL